MESLVKTCPDAADIKAVQVCVFQPSTFVSCSACWCVAVLFQAHVGDESDLRPSNRYVKCLASIPRLERRMQVTMSRLTFQESTTELETNKLNPVLSVLTALKTSLHVSLSL